MGIIEINCTYLNLGLLLLFLCNLGSIHGYFMRFCCSLFVRCCFPTQRCSQISPASTNRAPIHHESAKSLMPGRPLITSPRHGCCDVFFVGNVFQSFWFWAISDVHSGTSMTTCCVVNANIVYSYFQRGCRKKCTHNPERYCGWLSRTAPLTRFPTPQPPPPPPPTPETFAGNFPLFDERKGLRYRGLWQLLHTIKEQRGSGPGYFPPRWTGWNTGQFTFSLNSFYEVVFFIKFSPTFLSCIY